jgi:leader peptidase (prepilin peptidase)/N-methyltransferase
MSAFIKLSTFLFAIAVFVLLYFSDKPILFSMLLGVLLLLVAFYDFLFFRIPNLINVLILLMGIAYNISIKQSFWTPMVSFMIAGLLFYLLSFIYYKVRNRQGLGGGDIKLFACGAVWLLPYHLPLVLLISSFSALLYALLCSYNHAENRKKIGKIPFGPFLGIGIWCSWLFGREILNFLIYLS